MANCVRGAVSAPQNLFYTFELIAEFASLALRLAWTSALPPQDRTLISGSGRED
ncbi:hypothetical protein [Methylocella silvestris]|uniref:hypothetical protein n=1 Tax=Methylocella silvestris TaxID=199596 RepID=UPI0015E0EE48|nr:hypothetical protein [Methylocella silvestris]